MSKLTRRSVFGVAGIGAVGFPQNTGATEFDPMSYGLNTKLIWRNGHWEVVVVDWEGNQRLNWLPGQAPLYKTVPLREFLADVQEACGLPRDVEV